MRQVATCVHPGADALPAAGRDGAAQVAVGTQARSDAAGVGGWYVCTRRRRPPTNAAFAVALLVAPPACNLAAQFRRRGAGALDVAYVTYTSACVSLPLRRTSSLMTWRESEMPRWGRQGRRRWVVSQQGRRRCAHAERMPSQPASRLSAPPLVAAWLVDLQSVLDCLAPTHCMAAMCSAGGLSTCLASSLTSSRCISATSAAPAPACLQVELQEIVDFFQKPERFRESGSRIPRGVLLCGPPGTGKTLLARWACGGCRPGLAGWAGMLWFEQTGACKQPWLTKSMVAVAVRSKQHAACSPHLLSTRPPIHAAQGGGRRGGRHLHRPQRLRIRGDVCGGGRQPRARPLRAGQWAACCRRRCRALGKVSVLW